MIPISIGGFNDKQKYQDFPIVGDIIFEIRPKKSSVLSDHLPARNPPEYFN